MSCRKVVIIDDEPIICNLIKRLGEWDRLNLEIVGSATDGLEGYRLIRELHPDIVLLDIRMPGLDGLELIEKCSEEKLTPRLLSSAAIRSLNMRRRPYILIFRIIW